MSKRTRKQPLSVYIDPQIMAMLAVYAKKREQSLSLVSEAAIASFLSPDSSERHEAALIKRLDQIDRRAARLERDLTIVNEALATFVRFFLTVSPPLPEPAHTAARAKADERYEAFLSVLGRRLAKGPKLRHELPDDVPGSPPDQ